MSQALSSAESARLSVLKTGISLFTGLRQPSGVTALWDHTVPAAVYIVTRQNLTKRRDITQKLLDEKKTYNCGPPVCLWSALSSGAKGFLAQEIANCSFLHSASDFVLFLMLYHFVRPLHHRTHAVIQQRYFLFARPPLWQPSVLPAWACLKNISLGVTMSKHRAGRALYLACFSLMCCWSSIFYVSNGSFRYFPSKAKNEVGGGRM